MHQQDSEVQQAINVLSKAFKSVATNVARAPEVDFSVSWIDVTSIGTVGHSYEPVIELNVTKTELVNLHNLQPAIDPS